MSERPVLDAAPDLKGERVNGPQGPGPVEPTPIPPYDEEAQAMRASAVAFDALNDEQRTRVWRWLADRYRLGRGYFG